jgi:hypothetical protein
VSLYDWKDYAGTPPLARAQTLLKSMELRHQARLNRGDIGDWQSEFNEVYRALDAILEHLDTLKVK